MEVKDKLISRWANAPPKDPADKPIPTNNLNVDNPPKSPSIDTSNPPEPKLETITQGPLKSRWAPTAEDFKPGNFSPAPSSAKPPLAPRSPNRRANQRAKKPKAKPANKPAQPDLFSRIGSNNNSKPGNSLLSRFDSQFSDAEPSDDSYSDSSDSSEQLTSTNKPKPTIDLFNMPKIDNWAEEDDYFNVNE